MSRSSFFHLWRAVVLLSVLGCSSESEGVDDLPADDCSQSQGCVPESAPPVEPAAQTTPRPTAPVQPQKQEKIVLKGMVTQSAQSVDLHRANNPICKDVYDLLVQKDMAERKENPFSVEVDLLAVDYFEGNTIKRSVGTVNVISAEIRLNDDSILKIDCRYPKEFVYSYVPYQFRPLLKPETLEGFISISSHIMKWLYIPHKKYYEEDDELSFILRAYRGTSKKPVKEVFKLFRRYYFGKEKLGIENPVLSIEMKYLSFFLDAQGEHLKTYQGQEVESINLQGDSINRSGDTTSLLYALTPMSAWNPSIVIAGIQLLDKDKNSKIWLYKPIADIRSKLSMLDTPTYDRSTVLAIPIVDNSNHRANHQMRTEWYLPMQGDKVLCQSAPYNTMTKCYRDLVNESFTQFMYAPSLIEKRNVTFRIIWTDSAQNTHPDFYLSELEIAGDKLYTHFNKFLTDDILKQYDIRRDFLSLDKSYMAEKIWNLHEKLDFQRAKSERIKKHAKLLESNNAFELLAEENLDSVFARCFSQYQEAKRAYEKATERYHGLKKEYAEAVQVGNDTSISHLREEVRGAMAKMTEVLRELDKRSAELMEAYYDYVKEKVL